MCTFSRVPVCPCVRLIILVLVCGIMYHIRTYRYQLVISRLPRYVYVRTYLPGWGTYYVPHMYVNWCEHVCTWYQPAPKIRICRYVCTRATSPPPKKNRRPSTGSGSDTRTARQSLHSKLRVTTTASVTEGVAAVSWIQSLMIRRPFGSIDPNSIRETELHTECRRRREREACYYAAAVDEIT